jgi:hypothetical protein
MTRGVDFDELMEGADPDDRERLRRVHDMLVTAGPPAELPPEIEAGPTLAMTLGRPRSARRVKRRVALLAAAVIILLVAFLAGYITGNDQTVSGRLIKLQGTAAAPAAQGSLRLEPADAAGNWPMQVAVAGLPELPKRSYYEVFLVRDGKPIAPCGSFIVKDEDVAVSVRLNAPYRLRPTDEWIVTRQQAGDRAPGAVVLKPVT